ncbi:hypothetical protein WG909_03820 [Peptostreptococcaceae bacterium AGR-M142]
MFEFINNLPLAVVALILMSYVVSKASDKLGDVLHILGLKLNIPTSVRGATFDAISSSFPEFSTAMIAVLFYGKFSDVGLPTVSGSAVFNILLIPMASILAYKGVSLTVKVDKKVTLRDSFFYLLSIGALAIFTYLGNYNYISGLILLGIYTMYIVVLYLQTKKYRSDKAASNEEDEEIEEDMSYSKIIFWSVLTIGAIWFSIDAIIQSAIVVSGSLNIPEFIVSVIILAACTSIPDTLLSVKSSRRGDVDGAVSNAIGSNIFDICVCLGFPMLLAGSQGMEANFTQNIGVLAFVVLSMLTTGGLLLKKDGVHKKDAYLMLGVYILFIGYIGAKALGIVM